MSRRDTPYLWRAVMVALLACVVGVWGFGILWEVIR